MAIIINGTTVESVQLLAFFVYFHLTVQLKKQNQKETIQETIMLAEFACFAFLLCFALLCFAVSSRLTGQ